MATLEDELQSVSEQGSTGRWLSLGRIVLKAGVLFLLLNLIFLAVEPLNSLGRLSLYNWLLPGRERLPYGENAALDRNLTLNNLPAMFASHKLAQAKAADEFRVLVIGDSGTWGWLLENGETLAGQINQGDYQTADGRRIIAYNLGYPVLSVTKDLLLLDIAMAAEPDLIVWPLTLDSLPYAKQLAHPLLQNNPAELRALIAEHDLRLDPADSRFEAPDLLERTLVGQRRALADLLRLQAVGFSWAATGIDQYIPADFPLRKSDFEADLSWQEFEEPAELSTDELAFDVLRAGVTTAGDVPVLFINEPIFISNGENSDLRYNAFYPRWAYDQYRLLLAAEADREQWRYLDLWDAIPPQEFTNTPVHLTPAGVSQLAAQLLQAIQDLAD